ncbi:MAG: hypothetical protein Q4B26_06500 [Eubacteriales bacterium]|nr:hypothetical protein [Eubacteriales bacterium]
MEQIFRKLSEIEATAQSILDDADRTRQQLTLDMENERREYQQQLDQETENEISKVRTRLEQEKDVRLKTLQKDADEALSYLDSYYEEHHEDLSKELFRKILDA